MNLAINGFGRIGRQALRIIIDKHPDIHVVSINDLTDTKTLAHLFEFDSSYGRFNGEVGCTEKSIIVNGKEIAITAIKEPEKLPHKANKIDVVLECTGRFTKREDAALHLKAGAHKVIISAPCKDKADVTICMGINQETYDAKNHHVISNASCTTNCLAPLVKVLNDSFGIQYGLMTTIHSYTNDQNLLDLPHSDLRRARAAAVNMVPTSTGAAKAIGLVVPEVEGKLHGIAMRVPTPTGSITDLTVIVNKEVTPDEVNAVFKKAAGTKQLKGILRYEEKPIVLHDIVGDSASCIFDPGLTEVIGTAGQSAKKGQMIKAFGWYDNEWGYSNRIVELAEYVAKG